MARPLRIRKQAFTRICKPKLALSTPGISRILNSNVNCSIKIIWIFVLLLMTCLCCWQATNCILVYWSNPVVKETYTIRSPLVQFPVIYFCPASIRLLEYTFYNMANCNETVNPENCIGPNNPFIQTWVKGLIDFKQITNTPLSIVWQLLKPHKEEIRIHEVCDDVEPGKCTEDGMKLNIDDNLYSQDIATFWGTCFILNTSREVVYRGPFTYYKILHANHYYGNVMKELQRQLKNSSDESERNRIKKSMQYPKPGALISYNPTFAGNLHHMLYYQVQEIYQGFETHIKFKTKKFKYVNRTQNPCGTENEYLDCINICFEHTTTKDCRMPYIRTKNLDECKWGKQHFFNPHLANHKAYTNFNFSSCKCDRPCSETVITGSHTVVERTFNETLLIIKLFFENNMHEKIIEKENYSFNLCLSDIGGHFGFFLGLCLLTGVEIIESVMLHALYLINLKKNK